MKVIDDTVYEVDCKKITKGADNFGEQFPFFLRPSAKFWRLHKWDLIEYLNTDIGANPSAEEAEEGVEEGGKAVIDVVDAFRLNYLGDEDSGTRIFTQKKDYFAQLKSMATRSSATFLKCFSIG